MFEYETLVHLVVTSPEPLDTDEIDELVANIPTSLSSGTVVRVELSYAETV